MTWSLGIILGAGAFFFLAERIRPGREMASPPGWYARAVFLNACQLGIVVAAGMLWNDWFSTFSLFDMAKSMPPLAEGAVAWFVGTFVFYWWHRVRHEYDLVWRVMHQIHHSPARIETLTSFYKHPLEMASNSIIMSVLVFGVLGGSIEGAAWFNVFAAVGEFFYHANVSTPRWVGWFMQRPEHHSIHHQFGVHRYNYGDITWWDRIFGTFREAKTFSSRCGFGGDDESKLGAMLVFRDLEKAPKPVRRTA